MNNFYCFNFADINNMDDFLIILNASFKKPFFFADFPMIIKFKKEEKTLSTACTLSDEIRGNKRIVSDIEKISRNLKC